MFVCNEIILLSTRKRYRWSGAQQVAKVATASANINIRRRLASDWRRFLSSDSLHISCPCREMTPPILTYTTNVIDNGRRYCVINTSTVSNRGKLNWTFGNCTIHRLNVRPWKSLLLTRLNAACGRDRVRATSQITSTINAILPVDVLPGDSRRNRTVQSRYSAISVIVNVETYTQLVCINGTRIQITSPKGQLIGNMRITLNGMLNTVEYKVDD